VQSIKVRLQIWLMKVESVMLEQIYVINLNHYRIVLMHLIMDKYLQQNH
jgi:hypothetical protein